MELKPNIQDISAEMLLGYLYPELEGKWIARHEGTFYRNYNNDALTVDSENMTVSLARDGFTKLLPQGMINSEEELKGKDVKGHFEAMKKRNHLLNEAVLPIDTFSFRKKMQIERKVSELLEDKLDFILRKYFGIAVSDSTDPNIREVAYLLPFVSKQRGDMAFVRNLIESVFGCPVEMSRGRFSGTDNTLSWLPFVRYDLIVPGLDSEGYRQKMAEIKPFCNFLLEWFIPVDIMCRFGVKNKGKSFGSEDGIILDYNVEVD